MKKIAREKVKILQSQVKIIFPGNLYDRIGEIYHELGGKIFLSGGTVRDIFRQKTPADIDLTVDNHARIWASRLAELTGGAFVPLGREEDAARVVKGKLVVDFSSFRLGSQSIEEELRKRDITINSLAFSLNDFNRAKTAPRPHTLDLIDPVGGLEDINNKYIKVTSPQSFTDDPLRLIRIFRFFASLNFSIAPETLQLATRQKAYIKNVSAERIAHELDLIMSTPRAHETLSRMADNGLLFEIIPELKAGIGMQQPASHHLDVFEHNLETLRRMEQIIKSPVSFFPNFNKYFSAYLSNSKIISQLKWAAFFHDLGKPATYGINENKGGRIIFYNHDNTGAAIVKKIAKRLKWSNDAASRVSQLVKHHMRPFHLCNVQRKTAVSLKACLRLIKTVENELPGLFLLSMADSLAGQGAGRPHNIEEELRELLTRIENINKTNIIPVRSGPPLLTGKDLITEFNLQPGPIFKKILMITEEKHMENSLSTKQEALAMVAKYLEKK